MRKKQKKNKETDTLVKEINKVFANLIELDDICIKESEKLQSFDYTKGRDFIIENLFAIRYMLRRIQTDMIQGSNGVCHKHHLLLNKNINKLSNFYNLPEYSPSSLKDNKELNAFKLTDSLRRHLLSINDKTDMNQDICQYMSTLTKWFDITDNIINKK